MLKKVPTGQLTADTVQVTQHHITDTNMLTANIVLRYSSRTAHEEEIRKLQFLNKHHVFPDPDVCTNMGEKSR